MRKRCVYTRKHGLRQQATATIASNRRKTTNGNRGMQTEILLSFDKPPLNMNDRQHWRAKAAKTKAVRSEVHIRAKASAIPLGLPHIIAEMRANSTEGRS